MLTANRPLLLAAAALTAGAVCLSAHAADPMKDVPPPADMGMAGKPMMDKPMMADGHANSMVVTEMDQAKRMAADPAQAEAMAKDQAKAIVMDHLAHDPAVQRAATAAMTDPAMMKVHDQAAAMANDPAQMKKLQDEILADPAAMKWVMHQAMTMAAMQAKKMDHGMGMGHGMAGDKK